MSPPLIKLLFYIQVCVILYKVTTQTGNFCLHPKASARLGLNWILDLEKVDSWMGPREFYLTRKLHEEIWQVAAASDFATLSTRTQRKQNRRLYWNPFWSFIITTKLQTLTNQLSLNLCKTIVILLLKRYFNPLCIALRRRSKYTIIPECLLLASD